MTRGSAWLTSFGGNGVDCQWAYKSGEAGGSQVSISFGELRRSPDWQGYNPPNLGIGDRYASFVGYRAPELVQYLDAVFGDALRNPANGRGGGAGFSGWSSLIPLIGAGIQIAVNSEADGEMQKAMTSMGANALNDPPANFEYCFLTGQGVETPFSSQGFGAGSLTLCFLP